MVLEERTGEAADVKEVKEIKEIKEEQRGRSVSVAEPSSSSPTLGPMGKQSRPRGASVAAALAGNLDGAALRGRAWQPGPRHRDAFVPCDFDESTSNDMASNIWQICYPPCHRHAS